MTKNKRYNIDMKGLFLVDNKIGVEGAKTIGQALKANTSLTGLGLGAT